MIAALPGAGRRQSRGEVAPATLLDKIWAEHEVAPGLIYVDLHLLHEVSSPQAFTALREAGRTVRRPDRTLATADHSVPTTGALNISEVADRLSRGQLEALEANCRDFGIPLFSLGSAYQGIVHVIGPELGLTHPGMTIVCGDSHTSTHGAFGALALGIGTSEIEHVLATQCLVARKPSAMAIILDGRLLAHVSAKDVAIATIAHVGQAGCAGYAVEYCGEGVHAMSMDERMTICNMTIEAGGRVGMVAPDDTTFAYLEGRAGAPADFESAVTAWRQLRSDPDVQYEKSVRIDLAQIAPMVTWGTAPNMAVPVTGEVPDPDAAACSASESAAMRRALAYMDLEPGTRMTDIEVDRVFIGSCTNARLEDLRAAATVLDGRRVKSGVHALVVPGSQGVKEAAEREGLADRFVEAGFEWRSSGCSMCLGMNGDVLAAQERCASTSNRNFEGRQGPGGRTHLVSPAMAAAAAVSGRFVDVREWVA
jgi:3-isopropylmalate/(R)-2-methylmalate dehydratase large subunit